MQKYGVRGTLSTGVPPLVAAPTASGDVRECGTLPALRGTVSAARVQSCPSLPLVVVPSRLLDTLMQYAERQGYILAAVYGETPYDTHYYYVRPDFPDAAAIVQRIRSTRYIWYQTGRPCINYALLEPKASPKEP